MNLNFYTLCVIYLVYSFLGWVGETVVATAKGRRFTNRGVASGPFCFVYGTAGVLITIGLNDQRTSLAALFFGSMIYATVVEWLTAKLLERIHHRRWWDYSDKKFNLDGYVCLQYSLLWGLLGMAAVRWGNDLLFRLCAHLPPLLFHAVVWVGVALAVLDQISAMVVVSRQSASQGKSLYRCLSRELNLHHLQFIPLVDSPAPWSVTPEGWGKFLCSVFDDWLENDVGRVFIQYFDNLLGVWAGQPATLCTMQPVCGQSLLVEQNGDVYSCDHFVSAEYKLGNLKQDAMAAMASSPFQQQFGKQKGQLSARCQSCHWRFACHGGCPKHRFTIHDDEAQNYLCSGYLTFFGHITPYMNVMRRLFLNCQPPALIMSLIPEIRQNILQLTESEDERTK